jgi:hypothetical protein
MKENVGEARDNNWQLNKNPPPPAPPRRNAPRTDQTPLIQRIERHRGGVGERRPEVRERSCQKVSFDLNRVGWLIGFEVLRG